MMLLLPGFVIFRTAEELRSGKSNSASCSGGRHAQAGIMMPSEGPEIGRL